MDQIQHPFRSCGSSSIVCSKSQHLTVRGRSCSKESHGQTPWQQNKASCRIVTQLQGFCVSSSPADSQEGSLFCTAACTNHQSGERERAEIHSS